MNYYQGDSDGWTSSGHLDIIIKWIKCKWEPAQLVQTYWNERHSIFNLPNWPIIPRCSNWSIGMSLHTSSRFGSTRNIFWNIPTSCTCIPHSDKAERFSSSSCSCITGSCTHPRTLVHFWSTRNTLPRSKTWRNHTWGSFFH